jgi:hypothetical protein
VAIAVAATDLIASGAPTAEAILLVALVAYVANALPSVVDELEEELTATRKRIASDRQRMDRGLDAFERGSLDADQARDRIDCLAETKWARERGLRNDTA